MKRRRGESKSSTVGSVAVGDNGADFEVGGVAAGRGRGAVGGVKGREADDEVAVEGVASGGEEGFGGGCGNGG